MTILYSAWGRKGVQLKVLCTSISRLLSKCCAPFDLQGLFQVLLMLAVHERMCWGRWGVCFCVQFDLQGVDSESAVTEVSVNAQNSGENGVGGGA